MLRRAADAAPARVGAGTEKRYDIGMGKIYAWQNLNIRLGNSI